MTDSIDVTSKPASPSTLSVNAALRETLPFDDERSFEDARRGFIATIDPIAITADDGHVVWDLTRFGFIDGEAPDTVNPSLWRQARLNLNHGLFKVTDRIYQIRGFDMANMTIIEGDAGFVIIDPLQTVEGASAGMKLVREHLGDKEVTALIYTHSHADHFGGVKGVISAEDVAERGVKIVAPVGFMEHAIKENIYAGTAMSRRAQYMYGARLEPGAQGMVSIGLGAAMGDGTMSLLEPTDLISETGTELTLDGIRIVFQYTPDAEAPAEMNFHFPDLRALCMAENVSHNMHNLYTLRGAQIRDAAAWSNYIRDALDEFGDETDVVFISHHWPVWGKEAVREFMEKQRDLYRYIHDETLRLAAHGFTMNEIAERVQLPVELSSYWANRGYYGSLSHNVKAVYQMYLGWFDGNPAHLHPHEPVAAAHRYVEFMGGSVQLLSNARRAFDDGDYRWVAEVVNHLVFSDPSNVAAKALQADALEQLGYQAESGSWRNFYLTGAQELRTGVSGNSHTTATPDMLTALDTGMLLDYLAIRLNGQKAGSVDLSMYILVTDTEDHRFVRVKNGVLTQHMRRQSEVESATIRLTKPVLAGLVLGVLSFTGVMDAGLATVEGDAVAVHHLFGMCDTFERDFPIVVP